MRHIMWSAGAVLATLFATPASAGTVGHCSNCDLHEVEQVAAAMPGMGRVSRVAVLDYVRRFAWACDVHREPGVLEATAICSPGSVPAQAAFATITRGIAQLKTDTISIPYPGGNIFDLSGCQSCVTNWLLANRHAVAARVDLIDLLAAEGLRLAAALGVRGWDVQASYTGQVTLGIELANDDAAQNGRRAHCMATITGNGIVIDPDRCFDSDGNPIPTMATPNLQMRYTFNSNANFVRFAGRLAALGRPVRGAGIVTVGGVIDCTVAECSGRDNE